MPFVIAINHLETCLDSSAVVQFVLSAALDEASMRRLGAQGKLAYYPDFPKPYFCIRRSGWYLLQGILGESWLRVTYPPHAPVEAQSFLVAAMLDESVSPQVVPCPQVDLEPSRCPFPSRQNSETCVFAPETHDVLEQRSDDLPQTGSSDTGRSRQSNATSRQ